MEDRELVARALADGAEAFRPIVARYQHAVFAVALSRLRDFHDAEDVAQQVFIEAFQRLGSLKDPARLGAWLRSMTVNRCIDLLRPNSQSSSAWMYLLLPASRSDRLRTTNRWNAVATSASSCCIRLSASADRR